jgi:hypothetical protein
LEHHARGRGKGKEIFVPVAFTFHREQSTFNVKVGYFQGRDFPPAQAKVKEQAKDGAVAGGFGAGTSV